MPNDRNTNTFWKNVATGVGVAAAGAALAYLASELFSEPHQSNERCEVLVRRGRCGQGSGRPELRDSIIDKLNSGTYECNICLEEISRNDAIVSCKICYMINHLNCIRSHCDASDDAERVPDCPSCRSVITYDLLYYCFCGAVKNPPPRPGAIPHSCQSKCRNRHCQLQCHPGPCSDR